MAKKNITNNTNNLPEQEFNFIVSDVRIPRMVPLQTLADESGISPVRPGQCHRTPAE